MSTHAKFGALDHKPGRRKFFSLSGAMAATRILARGSLIGVAYADALTKEQRDGMTPDQIIDAMKHGNERFRQGKCVTRSLLNEQMASAKGQVPAAP